MSLIKIKEPRKKNVKDNLNCVGLDFGTTNSVCSIKINGKVEFIKDEEDKILVPSVVLFDDEKVLIGNQVSKNKNNLNSINSIKRNFTDDYDKNIFFNEKEIKASSIDVATLIFKNLKNNCDNFLKTNDYSCVLTVPAYYDEKARSGIMRSAFMAGFNVKRLINEPTAAAFAYGLEKQKRGNFFVYDLGGGTFDVSILKLSDGIFKVIGTGGDSRLGGDDFDRLFAEKILKDFFNSSLENLSVKDRIKIIRKSKSLKENLVTGNKIEELFELNNEKKKIEVDSDFLNISLDPLIDRTIDISQKLLNECDFNLELIDGFILVGGSSRLKRIEEKLKNKFNKKIYNEINPDLVVSIGASLHGYELLNGSNNLLLDVTPLSLGIETMGGLMEKIISRNTSIPCIKEQEFTTHENGQTSIKINVLQGERETTNHNRSLGEFILSDLKPKPAGIPRIKVRFSLDADGILFVSAFDQSSGKENNLVIKANNDLSIEEMRKIVESSIASAKEDINERMIIEAKIKGKKVLNEIESVKNDLELLCSNNEFKKIMMIVEKLDSSIKSLKVDPENINDLTDQLNESTKKFAQKRIEKDFSKIVGNDVKDI